MGYSFYSADILAPDPEHPKVLELNRGLDSGFVGYFKATGKSMLWDVVDPELKRRGFETWYASFSGNEIHNGPKTGSLTRYSPFLDGFGPTSCANEAFNRSAADRKLVFFRDGATLGGAYMKKIGDRKIILHDAEIENELEFPHLHKGGLLYCLLLAHDRPDVGVADSSFAQLCLTTSKTWFVDRCNAGTTTKNLIPKSDIYHFPDLYSGCVIDIDAPMMSDKRDGIFEHIRHTAEKIRADFPDTEKFVFKQPNLFGGMGIVFATRDGLEDGLKKYWFGQKHIFTGAQKRAFVVQERLDVPFRSARGLFAKATDAPAGKMNRDEFPRQPVIRIAFSYIDGELVCHGAYVKLSRPEAQRQHAHKTTWGAPYPAEDLKVLFQTLKPALGDLLRGAEMLDLPAHLGKMKRSRIPARRALAGDMLPGIETFNRHLERALAYPTEKPGDKTSIPPEIWAWVRPLLRTARERGPATDAATPLANKL